MINSELVAGIILAGGESRRMNFKDKSFKKINKITILDLVIERSLKQVDKLAINSNNIDPNKDYKGLTVLKDTIQGSLGPLVGVLTGFEWMKSINKNYKWLATFPVDSPFFPIDLVDTFFLNLKDENIIVAKSNKRIHPVFALWNIDLMESLRKSIDKNTRKIDDFTKKNKIKVVNFRIIDYDPFFNINNKDDLLKANKINELIARKGIRDEFC